MLSDFVAAVQATMRANGTLANDAEIRIGAEYVNEEGSPPRIVVEPDGDAFSRDPPPSTTGAVRNNRWLYRRACSAIVHLWGNDAPGEFAKTDALVHNFIAAADAALTGGWKPIKGMYPKKTMIGRLGREYLLMIEVPVPVTVAVVASGATGATSQTPTTQGAPSGTVVEHSTEVDFPSGATAAGGC